MRSLHCEKAGLQTLAEVIENVTSCDGLSRRYRQRLTKAVLIYCQEWLGGSDPAQMAADADRIEKHIRGLNPAELGITKSAFQYRRQYLLLALRAATLSKRHGEAAQLSPDWAKLLDLLDQLPKRPGTSNPAHESRSALRPLFLYLSKEGLSPENVTASHITAGYGAAVAVDASLTPQQARSRMARVKSAWRRAERHLAAWPAVQLPPPRPAPLEQRAWPLAEFPELFQEDVKRYCTFRGQRLDGEVSPDAQLTRLERLRLARRSVPIWASPRSLRPLSSTSIRQHVTLIRRAASALVRRGLYRIDEIQSISKVATIDRAAAMVDEALGREQPKTVAWTGAVSTLRAVAIRWRGSGLSLEELRQFDGLVSELRVRSNLEMSERVKDRLRQFTPSALHAVSHFPRKVFADVESVREQRDDGLVPFSLARKATAAIAVMILLTFAPRRRTLLGTHLDRNFIWHSGGTATLFYRGSETKTGQPISAELDHEDVRMLRLYETACLPKRKRDASNRYLFPALKGPGTMTPLAFGILDSDVLEAETGVSANLHLFRALLAQPLLSENPEHNRRLVNSLLGHRIDSIADHRYSEFLTRWASGVVKEILARELDAPRSVRLVLP